MAITATFNPLTGLLSIFGDNLLNTITVSRDAAGAILINGGAVPVIGGAPTVTNTTSIQAFGLSGDDDIVLDQTLGALPPVNLFGGLDNDDLSGGSGEDMLFGQAGNDTLLGRAGVDLLFGGLDNDVLTGGSGDDQMFGESGNDRMIWNPGDGTDLMEGGAGTDTAEVNGGAAAETFTATANGTRVRFDRLNPAPFSLDIGTTERLVLNMGGGNDTFSATGNLAALIGLTVDGGNGSDTILGSNGADRLIGGVGFDFIDGQQGNDIVSMGKNNDTFQWDPGDGSDTVDGGADVDTMWFNGSGASEIFEASANGGRVLFTRNVGNIAMDLVNVETIRVRALGGADTLTVNNLAGTGVTTVSVDLAATIGGTGGDAQPDTVIVNGTSGDNTINVSGTGTSVSVTGLAAQVSIANAEGANDALVINGLGGDDTITATTLPAGVIKLTIDGGAGDDDIFGSQGADVILGGADDDFVFGDNGNDVALLGAGTDVFQWDPGDGSDTIEGQAGADTMLFNGSNASENIDISANGGRVLFFRNIANVTMDLDDVETIDFNALGGADNIIVGDLTGTDVTEVDVDLQGSGGGGDGAADTVTVNATNGADIFGVVGDASGVSVFGLQAAVNISSAEAANDRLVLNGLGDADVIDASNLEAGVIQLTMNGSLGADTFLGSEGDDLINGGDGDDLALMGDGDDTFVWNPGDDNDTIEGQAGTDTMLFNGSNAAETVDISANGGRVLFFRNIANVTMDVNDTETIDFNALGGADTIIINDMTGTDLTEVNLNLAGAGGGGDAAADTIVINATGGDDTIQIVGDDGEVTILGLATTINITGFDAGDRIVINGLGGDDVIEASGLGAGSMLLTADGGAGNDVIVGGAGDDILLGGDNDDVLIGGGGTDVLDGGPGDDIEIQSLALLQQQAEWFV